MKGRHFTIPNLLGVAADSEQAKAFDNSSLAIFRLAPADYHRFHSPIDGVVGDITHIPGQYYTGACSVPVHSPPLNIIHLFAFALPIC